MEGQLDTHDLQAIMGDDDEFVGVFALDKLPQTLNRHATIKMIVNLDPSNLPGSHWVAIYRRNDGIAYYFDSFGDPPPKPIQTWLCNNSLNWSRFNKEIQSPLDKVSCGYLCIQFLSKL